MTTLRMMDTSTLGRSSLLNLQDDNLETGVRRHSYFFGSGIRQNSENLNSGEFSYPNFKA
jgi:hypothetical protein